MWTVEDKLKSFLRMWKKKTKRWEKRGNRTELEAIEARLNPRIKSYFGRRNQNNLDKSIIKDIHEENFPRIGQPRGVGRL